MAANFFTIGVLLLATITSTTRSADADSHSERNPVYWKLLEEGVHAADATARLPSPTLPDGLSAEEQVERIEQVGGSRYPFEKLARKSVVAPQIIRVPTLPVDKAGPPLRTVDVWFIVHADLELVSDPKFLTSMLNSQQDGGDAGGLSKEQLQARGISIAEEHADREAFGHLVYNVLDKVQINATGHSYWTETEQSVLGAVLVDPRFKNDRDFPNSWLLVEQSSTSVLPPPATPYEGVGFYVKVTTLQRPRGALFVEFHMVFAEPEAWFRGTNQLGSKLPAVLQSQVRTARRAMMRATQEASQGD